MRVFVVDGFGIAKTCTTESLWRVFVLKDENGLVSEQTQRTPFVASGQAPGTKEYSRALTEDGLFSDQNTESTEFLFFLTSL